MWRPMPTTANMPPTDSFTLAHLSDAHLAPLPAPRLRDVSLKRALGLANWLRRRN